MDLLEALDVYVVQLEANGRSVHTIGQYNRHIRLLSAWLSERDQEVASIDHAALARFLASPAARQRPDGGAKKATSTNALRSSLRAFFAYLHAAGIVAENPARLIQAARCSPPPPRAIPEADQDRLLRAMAEDDSAEGARDHALFSLIRFTGLRIGSAVSLAVEDVDLDAGVLRLRMAKGNREEKVVLSQGAVDLLRGWIGDRVSGPLFPGKHGMPVTTRHAQRRFRMWLDEVGITRRYTIHGLRHAFASRLYEKTRDVFLVQQALNHRSVTSTLVYARCDERDLRLALGA